MTADTFRYWARKYVASPTNMQYSELAKSERVIVRGYLLRLQGGVCGICRRSAKMMDLDHDHVNGLVRGVLCHSCNVRLGHLKIV